MGLQFCETLGMKTGYGKMKISQVVVSHTRFTYAIMVIKFISPCGHLLAIPISCKTIHTKWRLGFELASNFLWTYAL
jgi:hypothetical protein